MEADAAAAQRHGRHVRLLRRADRAAVAAGDAIDPVVEAPLQAVDHLLDVGEVEAGVEHALPIGLAVAVGVFEVEDVRSVGDEQAALATA